MKPTSQPPKGDTDELREQVLTEFRQVLKLAPFDYTENCTNVVMSLIEAYVCQREIEVLEEVWNRTQPSIVPEGTEPDELGKWLLSELKKQKEEV